MFKTDFSAPALKIVCALVCTMLIFSCSSAAAITIETVPVGDVGNANDQADGDSSTAGVQNFGAVNYAYSIGKYEVTVGQYAAFLNAIAATDTYGLYDHIASHNSIARSGTTGSYFYTIVGSPNLPVTLAGWGITQRFANWLHNGQPTGMQDNSTTEDGAYTLNGTTSDTDIIALKRNAGAKWFIPSENEWYKAAYYQPAEKGGDVDNYWKYPMRTNSPPYSDQPPGATPDNTRVGNFYKWDGVANGYDDGYAFPSCSSDCLTDVGAYTSAPSYYGTFDQGGNVWELNETGGRGGSWKDGVDALGPMYRGFPTTPGENYIGFRVAMVVPEPGSVVLIAVASFCISVLRRRRK